MQIIYFQFTLGLFPFNGSWPGGLGQLPAVKMGLADVNNNPNVLPGYRLRMTEDNTQVGVFTWSILSRNYAYQPNSRTFWTLLGMTTYAMSNNMFLADK